MQYLDLRLEGAPQGGVDLALPAGHEDTEAAEQETLEEH